MPENKKALKDICQKLEKIKESLNKCTNSSELKDITRQYKEINIKQDPEHDHSSKQLKRLQKKINQQIKHLDIAFSNGNVLDAPSSTHESILKRMRNSFSSHERKHRTSKNKEKDTNRELLSTATEQKTATVSEKTVDNRINQASPPIQAVIESHSIAPPNAAMSDSAKTTSHETTENSADLGSPERERRKAQLANFHKLLENLRAKRAEYETRYPKDNKKDTSKPYGALNELINKLSMQAESYQHATCSLQDFKNNATKFIRTARSGVLSEHRGCKQILTNILLCIATLGIGYLLAMAITKSISPLKVKTDTVERIDRLNESLDTLRV